MPEASPSAQQDAYSSLLAALLAEDDDALTQLVDPEAFTARLPGTDTLSFSGYLAEFNRQRLAFSDIGRYISMRQIVEQGNMLVLYYVMTMTHDGPLLGIVTPGQLPPTGRRVEVPCVDIVRFDGHGRIVEVNVTSDRLSTVEQLLRP